MANLLLNNLQTSCREKQIKKLTGRRQCIHSHRRFASLSDAANPIRQKFRQPWRRVYVRALLDLEENIIKFILKVL